MPQVRFKNTVFNVPDTIGGKPFLDIPDSERLDYFNLIEEKNPGIFSQGEAQSFVPEDEEDDIGFFEGVKNALGRGANQLTSSLAVQANRAGVLSEEGLAEQIATDQEDVESYPRSLSIKEGLQEITEAEGFGEAGLAALTNPLAALDVAIQSIVSSAPSLAGMFAGGVAGSALSPVGTFVGAATGAGAGSYAVEFGNTLVSKMQEDGIDTTDKIAVYNFLINPTKMAEAKEYAEKRAIPIAVVDAVSGGIAGKLLRPVSKIAAGSRNAQAAKKAGVQAEKEAQKAALVTARTEGIKNNALIAKRMGRAGASAKRAAENKLLGGGAFAAGLGTELAVQAGLGGAGEASAQLVADGHITSPGDIVLEMVAELPTGAIETAVGVRSNKKNYAKLVEAEIIDDKGVVNVTAELSAAKEGAPEGAVYQSTTKGLNPSTVYFDGQKNIIGTIDGVAQDLINSNIDVIENADTAETIEKKVYRVTEGRGEKARVINTISYPTLSQAQEAAKEQQNQALNSGVEYGVKEGAVYRIRLVDPSTKKTHVMSLGNIVDKEIAEEIVAKINENKASAIAERNASFNRNRARYSLMAQKKLKSKDASSKTDEQADFSAEEFEAAATDSFTEAEIAEEIAKLPALSSDSLAKVIRTISSRAATAKGRISHSLSKIRKDLKKEKDVTGKTDAEIEVEAEAIHNELINRGVITPKGSTVRTAAYIHRASEQEVLAATPSGTPRGEGVRGVDKQTDIEMASRKQAAERAEKEHNESITRFTPEFQGVVGEFKARLNKRLSEILADSGVDPRGVDVELVGRVDGELSGAIIENAKGRLLIKIAVEGQVNESEMSRKKYFDGKLDHEIFHIISELAQNGKNGKGPLTKAEINQLRNYVKQVKSPDGRNEGDTYYTVAGDIYGGLPEYQKNGVPDERLISEEAMAAAYSDWVAFTYASEAQPEKTDISKFNAIYGKLNDYFIALKETLAGLSSKAGVSFDEVNSIFKKIGAPSETIPIVDKARIEVQEVSDSTTEPEFYSPTAGNALYGNKSLSDQAHIQAILVRAREEVENSGASPSSKAAALKILQKENVTEEIPKDVITPSNRKRLANLRSKSRASLSQTTQEAMEEYVPDSNGGAYGDSLLKEDTKIGWLEKKVRSLRVALLDELDPLAHLSKKAARSAKENLADYSAFTAAHFSKNSSALVHNIISSAHNGGVAGVPVYRNGITTVESFTQVVDGENVAVGGLMDNLAEVIMNNSEEEFQMYMVAHRVLELLKVGQPTGINEAKATEIIQELNKKHSYFNLARKKQIAFNQKLIEYMHDTGQITNQQKSSYMDSISYIPFFREGTNTGKGNQFMPDDIESVDIPDGSAFAQEDVETESSGRKFKSIRREQKLKGDGRGYAIFVNGEPLMDEGVGGKPRKRFFSTEQDVTLKKLNELDREGNDIQVRFVQRPLDNMFNNYVKNITNIVRTGTKNVAAQRIVRDLLKVGSAFSRKKNDPTVNVAIKVMGETLYFQVDDPLVFTAMMSLNDDGNVDGDLAKAIVKVGAIPANVLRSMVTKDPGFMIANFMRDALSAYITSGTDAGPWNSAAGWISAIRGSESKRKLQSAGIFGGFDFASSGDSSGVNEISKMRKRMYPRGTAETIARPFRALWDFAERQTENSDLATRIAVYNDVLERTGNEAQAVWEAQEVLNFRRRGSHMKVLSAIIPFLNARMQGLDVIMRGFAGNPAARGPNTNREALRRKMMFRAAFIGSVSVLLYALGEEEDELKRVSDRVRDNNWIITPGMIGLSKQSEKLNLESFALKIPIPFEVGFFLKTVPDRLAALAMGNETTKETAKSFTSAISAAFATSYPTLLVPFLVSKANIDPLTGQSVLSPYEQAAASKDPLGVTGRNAASIDITLAEYMNAAGSEITPKEVSVIRNRMLGTIPGYFVTLFDAYSSSERAGATMKITEAPVFQRFLLDVGESAEVNQSISDLYQLRIEIDKIKPKYDRLVEGGKYEEASDLLSENAGLMGFQNSVSSVLDEVQKINEYKDYINNAPVSEFSREEKRRMIDEANTRKNYLEKNSQYLFREASRI